MCFMSQFGEYLDISSECAVQKKKESSWELLKRDVEKCPTLWTRPRGRVGSIKRQRVAPTKMSGVQLALLVTLKAVKSEIMN